ncbi:MAG: large subunit ribosomal protein [Archaeoglobi archaeon]|nr:large subunit ribosomal protein [Archaeoglobi archaeon]
MQSEAREIPQWKIEEVKRIEELVKSSKVVGIVGIRGIPSRQLQEMRKSLRDVARFRVFKNSLILRALDNCGGKLQELKNFVEDQTAILVSDVNPFKLYKILEATKKPYPIKAGQVAPHDIVVEKGPTNLKPGPVVGELQNAGIPAGIDKGKVVIRETKVVAKKGDVISPQLASALARLEIYPMEVGLNLRAVYEDGVIFRAEDLRIDTQKVFSDFVNAHLNAFKVALFAAIPTRETIVPLIQRAVTEARNLAINAAIFERDVMEDILRVAYSRALSIVSLLPEDALDDELRGMRTSVIREEKREEEKKEEEKKEEEEEKKEEEEEAGIAGLGALFG